MNIEEKYTAVEDAHNPKQHVHAMLDQVRETGVERMAIVGIREDGIPFLMDSNMDSESAVFMFNLGISMAIGFRTHGPS